MENGCTNRLRAIPHHTAQYRIAGQRPCYHGRGLALGNGSRAVLSQPAGHGDLRRRWFYDEQPGIGNSRKTQPQSRCADLKRQFLRHDPLETIRDGASRFWTGIWQPFLMYANSYGAMAPRESTKPTPARMLYKAAYTRRIRVITRNKRLVMTAEKLLLSRSLGVFLIFCQRHVTNLPGDGAIDAPGTSKGSSRDESASAGH